jgi:predicted RNase H-like nuclease (RuvC/YqgF family)
VPLAYTVGTIDSQFDITEDEVQRALTDAERIWEGETGRNLFVYTESKGLPVSFAYDERQQKTETLQGLEKNLESLPVDKSKEQAETKISQYEAVRVMYEKAVKEYQGRVDAFNKEVAQMNSKWGAGQDALEDLEKKKKRLEAEFKAIEEQRRKLNGLAAVVDKEVQENRQLVERYNSVVTNFNEARGAEEEFDQGVYTGDAITIYQYDDYQHLVLVLAHELGHALGLEHVEDSGALMYYLMENQDVNNISITQGDKEALNNLCQKPPFPWQ